MCRFFSLILKPHLWNHSSIESKLRWRVDEAIIGLVWDANGAVASANVAIVISVDIGKSAVQMENRRDPRTLPWAMPASIGKVVVMASAYLTMNCLLVR